ncbi:MAG: Ig-like domain-containing protein [Candidatus Wallbacteria bacterium]|nr:Ig-like domain-containing protein [Candidatus Wallbacteria bacterium]
MWNRIALILLLLLGFAASAELQIVNSVPKKGQSDIPMDSQIYVEFNQDLDPISVNEFTVSLSNSAYELPGKASYIPELKRLMFRPNGGLEKGEEYIFKVFSGVTSADGERLTLDFILPFDTGKKKDLVIPQIMSCSPEQGAKSVSANTELKVTFSKPLRPESLASSVKLLGGKKPVKLKYDYFPKQCLLSIKVLGRLEYETTYHLEIRKSVTDLSGNHLTQDCSLEFTTEIEPDKKPPEMLATLPRNEETNLPTTMEVLLKVSEIVSEDSLMAENIIIENSDEVIGCKLSYNPVIAEIRGIPEHPLKEGTDYFLNLKNFKDLSGNVMKPLKIHFSTGQLPDTVPPEVVEYLPKDEASDVPLGAVITLTFTEPVAVSTIRQGIGLTDGEQIVTGEISMDESMKVVSFKPLDRLHSNTHYRLTVKADIADLAGNHLANGFNSGFVTVKINEETAQDLVRNPMMEDDKKLDSVISDITGVPLIAPAEEIIEKEQPRDTEPVRILDVFPQDNFKGVALDSRICFIFNKELDEKSLTPENIGISQDKDVFEFSIIYDYEFKKLTLTPKSTFLPQKEVKVILKSGIHDKSGNPLQETRLKFITGDSLDSDIEISLKRDSPQVIVPKDEPKPPRDLEDTDFYTNDTVRQNFTRDEWARYLVERLQKIFVPDYEIKARDDFLKPSRYELTMIINKVITQYNETDHAYLYNSKKGIAKLLLLEQAVIEFDRELTTMGCNVKKFESELKAKGIPVDRMREDMDNGIIKGKT